MIKLECWSPIVYPSPEGRTVRLLGLTYGHPRGKDGQEAVTTPVVRAEGRQVTTKSGSTYLLGTIDPAYLTQLAEDGVTLNLDQPLAHLVGAS